MKCFGRRQEFAIEYEAANGDEKYLDLWVNNKPICRFYKSKREMRYKWNLMSIVKWFEENMNNILEEREFPLPIAATTSIDFYNLSGEFDTDDVEMFEKWFMKRQEWYFRHSWYVSRAGSYLADVLFWRVKNETIEIAWDNSHLYPEIDFLYPKGICYVDITLFKNVVQEFIKDFYGN